MSYLAKSSAGREALQARAANLTARDRQILVLANGKSLRADVEAMLGGSASMEIDRLSVLGYLLLSSSPPSVNGPSPTAHVQPTKPSLLAAAAVEAKQAVAAASRPMAAATAHAIKSEPTVNLRRSIAATKMYIIDMLQMMRRPEASALAAALHTSATEEELLDGALQAVSLMASMSGNSYALKVCTQLLAMVPLQHEPRVRAHAARYVDALV